MFLEHIFMYICASLRLCKETVAKNKKFWVKQLARSPRAPWIVLHQESSEKRTQIPSIFHIDLFYKGSSTWNKFRQ